MEALHAHWAWVAITSAGVVGLWGLVSAVLRRWPPRSFFIAVGTAVAAVLVQVGLGLLLYADPQRREVVDAFHVFYGVVIAFTLSFAYVFRAQIARRPTLWWGLTLLFVMGLGIRALTIAAVG